MPRSTPKPAGCTRWSAAGIIVTASSTAPSRPSVSPARQSSRSSTHGAARGLHPVERDPGRADLAAPGSGAAGLEPGQLRGQLCRLDHVAPSAGALAQPGDGAAGVADRPAGDRQDGREVRHHGQDAALLLDGARRRRHHPAAADRRLRDDRQWRALAAAVGHRSGAGPPGPHHLSEGHARLRRLLHHRRRAARPSGNRPRVQRDRAQPTRPRSICRARNIADKAADLQADPARPVGRSDRRHSRSSR